MLKMFLYFQAVDVKIIMTKLESYVDATTDHNYRLYPLKAHTRTAHEQCSHFGTRRACTCLDIRWMVN